MKLATSQYGSPHRMCAVTSNGMCSELSAFVDNTNTIPHLAYLQNTYF